MDEFAFQLCPVFLMFPSPPKILEALVVMSMIKRLINNKLFQIGHLYTLHIILLNNVNL